MEIVELSQKNFEKEVLKSDKPVIIDFWAHWCMPCRMMAPVFDELSKDYSGRLKFAKLDTEKAPAISSKYRIISIPCLVIINKGEEIGRILGLIPKETLKLKINQALKGL